MIISDIVGFLRAMSPDNTTADVKNVISITNRQIRSISSFSSNTIFYFPLIVSDQCRLDEVTMIARALEKQYASFVVACISLIPFQRVSSSNVWAVDEYLKQFHQNIGTSQGMDTVSKVTSAFLDMAESAIKDPFLPPVGTEVEQYFLNIYNESVAKHKDYVKYLSENYISINSLFNEEALDPYTKALAKRYEYITEELDTWGFVGDTPPESITDIGLSESYDEYEYMNEASIADKVTYTLDSIPDNKIKSCKNKTKLRTFESKLNGLKNKYTMYLKRYKKNYKNNQEQGINRKLVIRFNKTSVSDPKEFMLEFGMNMKHINRKLKLCKARREELNKKGGKSAIVTATESVAEPILASEYRLYESSVSKDTLFKSDFGLPDKQKYPIHDPKHVKLAIQMSGHVKSPEERKTLADNIVKKAKEFDMIIKVSKNNVLYQYMPETMRETALEDPLQELTVLDENIVDTLLLEADQDMKAMDETFLNEASTSKPNQFKKAKKTWQQSIQQLQQRNDKLQKLIKQTDKSMDDLKDSREKLKDLARSGSGSGNSVNLRARGGDFQHKTFDREIFTAMDMDKANEMVPTFAKANIGFIVDGTEQVETRTILVGIKTYVHRVQSAVLVNEIYQTIIQKRKFLQFIKFITGEEKSLVDLLFGINELKLDANKINDDSLKWSATFKNRRRLCKLAIPFVMKKYTPNGTIVMTMNEVEYIKANYGIDIISSGHAKMIMDANFLLGFVILDQANEIAYVMYDGINQGQFQQYSFASLEREQKNTDRTMRDLFRLMNK